MDSLTNSAALTTVSLVRKKTRNLIMENYKLPMKDVHKAIDTAWEDWKGDYKQTDDVLMIGIKF